MAKKSSRPTARDMPPSLWAATAAPASPFQRLEGLVDVDLAVIGGGFSGLSTALHARERGLTVAVLEAAEIGWGASGRNNGQVIPTLSRRDPEHIIQRFGDERGERMIALVRDSARDTFDLIRRYGIDCEAEQTGWIQPAHSPGRVALARRRCEAWAARGAPAEFLDEMRLAELLGSDVYFGGWMNRSGGHVNPLALARGMAAAADRFGAHVFVRSRAKRIQRVGDRWEVKTATGSLRAARVVIATNAYSDDLWPALSKSIVKIHSWQVATEPLGDNLRATILPGRQAVSDTRGELGFFRYDARGRLVTGGTTMSPMRVEERVLVRVGERLGEWFPALGEPRFDFAWRGYVGITRDFFPHLHTLGDGIFAWIGCNGRGVALAVALGRELAAVAAGADPAELSVPTTPLATIPLHRWVQRIAPKVALWSYRRRDRREVRI